MLSVNFRRSKSVQPPPRAPNNKKPKNRRTQHLVSKVKLKAKKRAPKVKVMQKPHSRRPSSRSAKLSINSKPLSSSSRVSKARLSTAASASTAPRSRKEEGKSRGSQIPLTQTRERSMP